MLRRICGFRQDDDGDWVAELSCLHGQHVRHLPPMQEREWVLDPAGREARLGSEADCPLCDRFELPEGLSVARVTDEFSAGSTPPGLRREHRVAEGVWGVIEVVDGVVDFTVLGDSGDRLRLTAGTRQPIPPGVVHEVSPDAAARFRIEFWRQAGERGGTDGVGDQSAHR